MKGILIFILTILFISNVNAGKSSQDQRREAEWKRKIELKQRKEREKEEENKKKAASSSSKSTPHGTRKEKIPRLSARRDASLQKKKRSHDREPASSICIRAWRI